MYENLSLIYGFSVLWSLWISSTSSTIDMYNHVIVWILFMVLVLWSLGIFASYRTSHRYWANFSTWYLWLKSIFLGCLTHGTWLLFSLIYFQEKLRFVPDKFWSFVIFCYLLGNLEPCLGTWTCTQELWSWPVLRILTMDKKNSYFLIDFRQSYQVSNFIWYRWLIRYIQFSAISKLNL